MLDIVTQSRLQMEPNVRRGFVRRGKLLEFSVKEGWEPLCAFLGVPVPDVPFPWTNSAGEIQNHYDRCVFMNPSACSSDGAWYDCPRTTITAGEIGAVTPYPFISRLTWTIIVLCTHGVPITAPDLLQCLPTTLPRLLC